MSNFDIDRARRFCNATTTLQTARCGHTKWESLLGAAVKNLEAAIGDDDFAKQAEAMCLLLYGFDDGEKWVYNNFDMSHLIYNTPIYHTP